MMQLSTVCCFLTVAVRALTCFSREAIRAVGELAAVAAPAKIRAPAKHTAMIRFTCPPQTRRESLRVPVGSLRAPPGTAAAIRLRGLDGALPRVRRRPREPLAR